MTSSVEFSRIVETSQEEKILKQYKLHREHLEKPRITRKGWNVIGLFFWVVMLASGGLLVHYGFVDHAYLYTGISFLVFIYSVIMEFISLEKVGFWDKNISENKIDNQ